METRPIQRLQEFCCNIRPRLWHDVIIVCIQIGLPLPILIANFEFPRFILVDSFHSYTSVGSQHNTGPDMHSDTGDLGL